MNAPRTVQASVLAVFAATCYAIVMTTGVLVVGFVIVAAAKGYTLGELYLETFPAFRGVPHVNVLTWHAYALFFLYVVGAAQIAIVAHRHMLKRGFNS